MEAELKTPDVTPRFSERFTIATGLQQQGRLSEAESLYRELLATGPVHPEVLAKLGCLLVDTGRSAEAIPLLEESLRLDPDRAEVHNNLGAALMNLRRNDEAAVRFERSAELWPEFVHAHGNLGNVRYRLQELDKAERAFRRTLEVSPGLATARFGLGMTLLLAGKYEEGWRQYSGRFEMTGNNSKAVRPPVPFPLWTGQSLKGRSILVWREQGFGDEIMGVRYATKLKEMGATRVSWVCSPSLREIFRRVKGVSDVWTEADLALLPAHDYCCSALDLPALLGVTPDDIPGKLPYISVEAKRLKDWKKCLPAAGLKVGLVWKGDSTHLNDANRSLASLAMLTPLWRVPDVTFVSLQKGAGGDEASRPSAGQPLIHLGGGLRNFSDTAAIVEQLDLVICVDTAVAHVAGALGKPVWVLLPFELVDWRWLIGRDDSPWYPGVMRLFRQGKNEPWSAVIERVATALAELRGH